MSDIKKFLSKGIRHTEIAVFLILMLFIVPIILYFVSDYLLNCSCVKSNWFAFYGSFVGGIATLIMAYITIKITKQQIIAENKRDRLNYIRTDLARLFSIDFIYDIFANFASGNIKDKNEEKRYQLMLWSHFQSLKYSAELNYNTLSSTKEEIDFYNAYSNLMSYCQSLSYTQILSLYCKNKRLAELFTLMKVVPIDQKYTALFQKAKEKAKILVEAKENECNNVKIF